VNNPSRRAILHCSPIAALLHTFERMRPGLCDDDGVTHATFNEKRTKRVRLDDLRRDSRVRVTKNSPVGDGNRHLMQVGGQSWSASPLKWQIKLQANTSPRSPEHKKDTTGNLSPLARNLENRFYAQGSWFKARL